MRKNLIAFGVIFSIGTTFAWGGLSPTTGGSGDVTGPASGTDNAAVRFDGTGGKTLQDSGIIIDDTDNITGVTSLVIDAGSTLDLSGAGTFGIAQSAGANTITIGGATSTVSVPGDLSIGGDITLTGASTGDFSVGDNNITNVADIALDTISSDAATSIGITLGTDAGDDLLVSTNKLVVEGDTGNVGIGTAGPDTTFHINHANQAASAYENKGLMITEGAEPADGLVAYARSSNEAYFGLNKDVSAATGYLIFGMNLDSAANKVDALTIRENGYVGIGTVAPGAKLEIKQAGAGDAIRIQRSVDSSYWGIGYNPETGTSSLDFNAGGTSRMVITNSGNVGIGTTSPNYQLELSTDSAGKPTTNTWTISSDERIKTEIRDFGDGLNTLMGIRPVKYKYNGKGGLGYDDKEEHIGIIAQELEKVAPYMVEIREGEINGETVDDFRVYQGHALPFIIVNAIQEQQDQIEILKEEIAALKNE